MPPLSPPYRHNKPNIAFATALYTRDTHVAEAAVYSLNWIVGNPNYEKILSKTGLTLKKSLPCASRISKHELMKRFVDVWQHIPAWPAKTPIDAKQSYAKMKAAAVDYNRAKEACIKAFKDSNLGDWNKMQKPPGIDNFTL